MEHILESMLGGIQKIPGETRAEKLKTIGRIVRVATEAIQQRTATLESIINTENTPNSLVPLIKVLVGAKLRQPGFIVESLRSADNYIIKRAFHAKWFFDGSDRSVTNFEYFSENILPYISAKIRKKVAKKLSTCLKYTVLAEGFFLGFLENYGISEAASLLFACQKNFIYDSIVKYKIILDNRLIRALFQLHPDMIIRYLKYINPSNCWSHYMDVVDGHDFYEPFLPLLIKDYPEIFMDFQEMLRISQPLGNKRTLMFLRKGKHLLINRPRDVIDIMPFKLVCSNLSEDEFDTMFGNLFPVRSDMFNLKEMLGYLEYYPVEKRGALLTRKFKEFYGCDMFDDVSQLTSSVLLLFPQEERHQLARRIIQGHVKFDGTSSDASELSWWCYLPVDEALSAVKLQISQEWKARKKKVLIYHLICICKINNNYDALLDVLKFIDETHGCEKAEVICPTLENVVLDFDLSKFNQNHWTAIFSIVKKIKLRKDQARDYWILEKILKKYVHYCYENQLPYDEVVEVIVKLFLEGRVGVSWKLLEDEAVYERIYMNACLSNNYWLDMDYKKNIVEGIYNFNERHCEGNSKVERLSLKQYPHLMRVIEETVKKECDEKCFWINYTKEKLRKHEPELFREWFPNDDGSKAKSNLDFDFCIDVNTSALAEIAPVTDKNEKKIYVTEAIIALKKNSKIILDNWTSYYECCKNDLTRKKQRKRIKVFLKTLIWYPELPIKFAEKAIEEKNLDILGYLLDGPTFCKVIETILPNSFNGPEEKSQHHTYVLSVINVIKNTSLLVPPSLVDKHLGSYEMYECRNYINSGLALWSYVANRCPSNEMMELARKMASHKLFMKKHAIRLVHALASKNDAVAFYTQLWENETHPYVKKMLAEKIGQLFINRPSTETWNLVASCLASLKFHENYILEELLSCGRVPVKFASVYAIEVLRKLRSFVDSGLSHQELSKSLITIFRHLDPESSDLLPEDFYREIIRLYIEQIRVTMVLSELTTQAQKFILTVYLKPQGERFEIRFQCFSEILTEELQRYHQLPYPERKKAYSLLDGTINTMIHVVRNYKDNAKLTEKLFDFVQKLSFPFHHVSSYLNLFFCIEFVRADCSFMDFGARVDGNINKFIDKFGVIYLSLFADLVSDLFQSYFQDHDYVTNIKNRVSFIEGLVQTENTYSIFIATRLLDKEFITSSNQGYYRIMNVLGNIENPAIQSLL